MVSLAALSHSYQEIPKASEAAKTAHALWEAMHGGVWGLGTEKSIIFSTLANKSKAELDEIRTEYSLHYRKNLDTEIKRELSGSDLERANAYLTGDNSLGNAIGLREALNKRAFTEAISIIAIDTDNNQLGNTFKLNTGRSINEYANSKLPAFRNSAEIAENLTALQDIEALKNLAQNAKPLFLKNRFIEACENGNLEQASSIINMPEFGKVRMLLDSQPKSYVSSAFQAGSPFSLSSTRYVISGGRAQIRGIDFQSLISKFPEEQAEFLTALSEHDKPMMIASAIKILINKPGFDKNDSLAINKMLSEASSEERKEVASCYSDKSDYKLRADLRARQGAEEFSRTEKILLSGKLSQTEELYYALTLKDPASRVFTLLNNSAKEDRDGANRLLLERGIVDLNMAIYAGYSGRERFILSQATRGAPQSLEEIAQRLNERKEFEFSTISNVLSDKDRLVEKQIDQLNLEITKLKKSGTEPSAQKIHEILKLTAHVSQDLDSYVNAKDSIAKVAPAMISSIAGAACIVLSDGTLLPVVAAGITGGGAYCGTKKIVAGDSYISSEYSHDFLLGAINGASALIGMKIGAATATRTLSILQESNPTSYSTGLARLSGGAANGASASIAVATLEGIVEGESPQDIINNAKTAGLVGLALGSVFEIPAAARLKTNPHRLASKPTTLDPAVLDNQSPRSNSIEQNTQQTALLPENLDPQIIRTTNAAHTQNIDISAICDWINSAATQEAQRLQVIIKGYHIGSFPRHMYMFNSGQLVNHAEPHLVESFVREYSTGNISAARITQSLRQIREHPITAAHINDFESAWQNFETRASNNNVTSAARGQISTEQLIHLTTKPLTGNRAASKLAIESLNGHDISGDYRNTLRLLIKAHKEAEERWPTYDHEFKLSMFNHIIGILEGETGTWPVFKTPHFAGVGSQHHVSFIKAKEYYFSTPDSQNQMIVITQKYKHNNREYELKCGLSHGIEEDGREVITCYSGMIHDPSTGNLDYQGLLTLLNGYKDKALTASTIKERAEAMAEFEWLHANTNPGGFGGKTILATADYLLLDKAGFHIKDSTPRVIELEGIYTPHDQFIAARTKELESWGNILLKQ